MAAKEKRMKIYVTFGQIHTHSVNGKTFDKDTVAMLEVSSYEEGRKKAFEYFGDKFFTTYTENEMTKEVLKFFPKGILPVNPIRGEEEKRSNFIEDVDANGNCYSNADSGL